MRDHVLMLALSINWLPRTFHWWSISCHWGLQTVPGGGPTIDLHNFRKWVSIRCKHRLYMDDVRQRSMPLMTVHIQSAVNALQWKHFRPANSCGRLSLPGEADVANPVESSRVEPACPKAAPVGRRETTKTETNFNSHYFGVENWIKESICVSQKSVCIAVAFHSPNFCHRQ